MIKMFTSFAIVATVLCLLFTAHNSVALQSPKPSSSTQQQQQQSTRRAFVTSVAGSSAVATAAATVFLQPVSVVNAFDGSGSSAYSGRNPSEKAAKVKSYRDRIVADVKDFNRLGVAIRDKGELEGDAWVNFFIEFQRREADSVGRTYAALLDLIGVEKSGGAALLLATTYAKPNKPPQNLPQYKKYDALLKTFDPIKAAGKAGDLKKATKEYGKASTALSEYLEAVDLPADLNDPIYK